MLNKLVHKGKILKSFLLGAYSLENIFLYFMAKKSYKRYDKIEFSKIRDSIKKSDTVVIYGTGSSILDISEEQWKELREYNSISIGSFAQFNKYIDIDINHFREIGSYNYIYKNSRVSNWQEMVEYAVNINNNDRKKSTIHLFQDGIIANASNRFICSEVMEFNSKYSMYTSNRKHSGKLSREYSKLSHINGSLGEAINIASQLKWKRIILAGIDLRDRQYFFLKENETVIWDLCRNEDATSKHNMAESTMKHISSMEEELSHDNIELYVLNKKSLLASLLEVFTFR